MAMLVVLLEADGGDVPLGPRAVARLARLGVTNVALLRDEQTVCMVLEGWAFDPVGSASEVVSTISVGMHSGRALQPVMQIAVEGSSAIGSAKSTSPSLKGREPMKRVCVRSFGRRSLPVVAIGVVLCALSATTSGSLLAQDIEINSVGPSRGTNVFYTTSSGGPLARCRNCSAAGGCPWTSSCQEKTAGLLERTSARVLPASVRGHAS